MQLLAVVSARAFMHWTALHMTATCWAARSTAAAAAAAGPENVASSLFRHQQTACMTITLGASRPP